MCELAGGRALAARRVVRSVQLSQSYIYTFCTRVRRARDCPLRRSTLSLI